MFIKNTANNYLIKARFPIGKALGCENDDDVFIVLKEMPVKESITFLQKYNESQKTGELVESMEYFMSILPILIVDHNFMNDETTKMTNEQVTALINEKAMLAVNLFSEYSKKIFFTQA